MTATRKRRPPRPTADQLEAMIQAAYPPKELHRLRLRLKWAQQEMQELRRRVPQAAEFYEIVTPDDPRQRLSAESRRAIDWLMGTLGPRRAKDMPSPRVLLSLVRSGHLRRK